jgi:hypothetical protein
MGRRTIVQEGYFANLHPELKFLSPSSMIMTSVISAEGNPDFEQSSLVP